MKNLKLKFKENFKITNPDQPKTIKYARMIFLIGIIFVLLGGQLIINNLNNKDKVQVKPLEEYEVPIIAKTITENQKITTSDYKTKKMKLKDIPETIIKHENDIIGKCVKEGKKLKKGQYFQIEDIVTCEDELSKTPGPDYYDTIR